MATLTRLPYQPQLIKTGLATKKFTAMEFAPLRPITMVTSKGYNDNNVKVIATCKPVPVMCALAQGVNLQFEKPLDESQRGRGGLVTLKAADNSIGPVTGPHFDVTLIPHYSSDINGMTDAMVFFSKNSIPFQLIEFSAKGQKELSDNGQSIIIATDHGAGDFLDKVAFCASGVVIGVPMRASAVTGVPASSLGMSPKRPILLVDANDIMGAATLALSILAFGCPEAKILKEM